MRRKIAVVDWPQAWGRNTKKTNDDPKVKNKIAESMKMRRHNPTEDLATMGRRFKPITNIVRKPNGEINKRAVKNLIHSLEDMLSQDGARR